jgi:hypothetical protein
LGALLLMFTPFLREFTTWHIDGFWLAGSAFVLGLAISLSILRIRTALLSVLAVIVLASFIESFVIVLPAIRQLVPNPVSYINQAETQLLLGCLTGGTFVIAGGVLGISINLLLHRNRESHL